MQKKKFQEYVAIDIGEEFAIKDYENISTSCRKFSVIIRKINMHIILTKR